MEEIKIYEKMTREERGELIKHYNSKINPRVKILRIIAVAMMIPTFIFAGFVFYHLIKFYSAWKLNDMFWIWGLAFMLTAFISISLSMWGLNGLYRWIWLEKNILSQYWKKTKNSELETRSFSVLSKAEKHALRNEFKNTVYPNAKKWLLATIILIVAACGFAIFQLILWAISGFESINIWFLIFILPSTLEVTLFIKKQIINIRYFPWLEYEKGIIKG